MNAIKKVITTIVETERINSIDDVIRIIEKKHTIGDEEFDLEFIAHLCFGGQLLFRGQERWEYQLKPNITRNINQEDKLRKIEQQIVYDFEEELKKAGFLDKINSIKSNKKFQKEWSLLQQAQHYGLPTRLLDWTIKIEIALFFAVEKEINDDSDGQFWIFLKPDSMTEYDNPNGKCYYDLSPFEVATTKFINSGGSLGEDNYNLVTAEQRKWRQMGRFSIQPAGLSLEALENQSEFKGNIIRILIPKESKKKIRKELEERGCTRNSVYIKIESEIDEIVTKIKNKYNI